MTRFAIHESVPAFLLLVVLWSIMTSQTNGQYLPSEGDNVCRQDINCVLPDCFCANNTAGPSEIPAQKRPQIVVLSFNDAVNERNFDYYIQMLKSGWYNSNGCPVSFTLFIPDPWTNYTQVQQLYLAGAEIASFGLSGYKHNSWYYQSMTKRQLLTEIGEQKKNFVNKAQIPPDAIRGFRMPYFDASGPSMFDLLAENGYTYDSSLLVHRNSMDDPPSWPSTMTFPWPLTCKLYGRCPSSHNGSVWEIPVNVLLDLDNKYECQFLDACVNAPRDEEDAFQLLWKNFLPFYRRRTPFVLNMRATWLNTDFQRTAFHRLIYTFMDMPEVYMVTMSQLIDWMRNVTSLENIDTFDPWLCPERRLHGTAALPSQSHISLVVTISLILSLVNGIM